MITDPLCSLLILYQQGRLESEIRRQLTVEEEKDELASTVVDSSDGFTETRYLLYALDLEEQQYVFSRSSLVRRTNRM